MPKKRPPREIWREIRRAVWQRDGGQCVRCQTPLPLNKCHIDHIVPLSRGGANEMTNLRTLCRGCHVLRADNRHRGMIAWALRLGIIPPNWREQVWED